MSGSGAEVRWAARLLAAIGAGCVVAAGAPTVLSAAPAAQPAAPPANSAAPPSFAAVTADHPLAFPADFGSHPQFRSEWWYLTGWLTTVSGEPLGFQITFFRAKSALADGNPSAFAPRQLLIAHCAISDPKHGRLWRDQRIRRAGLGLAEAAAGDTDVWIDDWSLKRAPPASGTQGVYTAKIDAEDFSFNLSFLATQDVLLNGNSGVSSKGPAPGAASYYYSLPHLQVAGSVGRQARTDRVTGEAWLDHEWSSDFLDAGAVGWDWVGINLDHGAALMAFRIRGAKGEQRWAGGTIRGGDGKVQILQPSDIAFRPGRRWVSRRTGIAYPVEWSVRAGPLQIDLEPLLDDQENDARISAGAIYWEGAVSAYEKHRLAGRGYLELTGYGEPLRLR